MASDAARKSDTYRKIQLGGLVIKAGLGDQPPAIILGALVDALWQLHDDPNKMLHFKSLGDATFAKGQGRETGRGTGRDPGRDTGR